MNITDMPQTLLAVLQKWNSAHFILRLSTQFRILVAFSVSRSAVDAWYILFCIREEKREQVIEKMEETYERETRAFWRIPHPTPG